MRETDFPPGTCFYIKEYDVPLAQIPGQGWWNWFGGRARRYDPANLKPGNQWLAESFAEWLAVVEASRDQG